MCETGKKFEALDDNDLDRIVGGLSDEAYLDEERIPLGWRVTCYDCKTVFSVSEGACPRCGSTHVRMTF